MQRPNHLPLRATAFAAILAAVTAPPVAAAPQQWVPSLFDDSHYAVASASVSSEPTFGMSVYCAGKSPQPKPTQPSDITELQRSDPGEVLLTMEGGLVGGMDSGELPVTLVIDGAAWTVGMQSNLADEFYYVGLPFDAALLGAMQAGSRLTIASPRGTSANVSLRGSSAALEQTLDYCRTTFPGPGTPAAASPQASATWWTAASLAEHEAAACAELGPGAPTMQEGFVRETSIDGDGTPDFLVDLSKLMCASGTSRSERQGARACASLGCPLSVYVSASGTRDAVLDTTGFDLVPHPLGGGRADVYSVINGTPCGAPASEFACAQLWRWNGAAFERSAQPVTMAAMRAALAGAADVPASVAPGLAPPPVIAPAPQAPGAPNAYPGAAAPTPTTSAWVEAPADLSPGDYVMANDLTGALLAVSWYWENGVEMGQLGSLIFAPGPVGPGVEIPNAQALMQDASNSFQNSYDATATTIRVGFEGNAPQTLPAVAGVSPWIEILDSLRNSYWIQRARVLETNIAGLDASRIHLGGALMPNFAGLTIDGASYAVFEVQTRR